MSRFDIETMAFTYVFLLELVWHGLAHSVDFRDDSTTAIEMLQWDSADKQ